MVHACMCMRLVMCSKNATYDYLFIIYHMRVYSLVLIKRRNKKKIRAQHDKLHHRIEIVYF